MHYSIYLFTKELPNDEEIARIMAPYYEYAENESPNPNIRYDGFVVGGRYGGMLKLKTDLENDEKYKWNFYIDEPRSGRLFRNTPIENLINLQRTYKSSFRFGFYSFNDIEDTLFRYLGIKDGYIRCDGCKITDLCNLSDISDKGCGFIDVPYNQQGTRFTQFFNNENPGYEELLLKAFERNHDNYVTILDLHI